MARFKRLQTLNKIEETGIIPIFYNDNIETAKKIVKASAEGGVSILEFTNRGDFAYEIFAELEKFIKKNYPDMIFGVGTVVDPHTAAIYIASGANFIVSPILNEDSIKLCNRRKIPHIPGCGSVTEIQKAEELGCEFIKIFPAGAVGGPGFVKAVKGPLSHSSLIPAGGVSPTKESLKEWFDAGVSCVAMGSKLFNKEQIKKNEFSKIKDNIKNVLKLIKEVK